MFGSTAAGASSVAENVPLVMARTFQTIKEATGIDLAEIAKADTYDAKVNRNINVTGLENVGKDAAEKIADIAEKVAEDKAKAETEETK